ncbi:ASCH domain-containing protein [Bdellovibrio sp. GT3]|uniref:ASCH domain-containing protein n=1 Tax=Bdellovibrio sp. GT3 TaxID=3136282 RepID=UPI0030F1B5A9
MRVTQTPRLTSCGTDIGSASQYEKGTVTSGYGHLCQFEIEKLMVHSNSVIKMWRDYHVASGIPIPEIVADSFSDNKMEATELSALVNQGIKRATVPALWAFEKTGTQLPEVGGIFLVVDGNGEAVCIVKTTRVSIIPFNEITESQAYREGEGDRTLDYWRRVHAEYYKRQFETLDLNFEESMPIVFEEFEKIFPETIK